MMNESLEHDWASLAAGCLVMRRLVELRGREKQKTIAPPRKRKGNLVMVWIRDAKARHVVRQLKAQKTTCDEVGKQASMEYGSGRSPSNDAGAWRVRNGDAGPCRFGHCQNGMPPHWSNGRDATHHLLGRFRDIQRLLYRLEDSSTHPVALHTLVSTFFKVEILQVLWR